MHDLGFSEQKLHESNGPTISLVGRSVQSLTSDITLTSPEVFSGRFSCCLFFLGHIGKVGRLRDVLCVGATSVGTETNSNANLSGTRGAVVARMIPARKE